VNLRIVESDATTTRPLRRAVLRPGWSLDAPMHGDEASDAVHLAAYPAADGDADELVGACLLLPRAYPGDGRAAPAWQLRGMATAADFRGRGIGAAMLAVAVDLIRERGGRLVWCEARTSAVPFYRQHGFTVDGPEYLHGESALPHHLMSRRIDSGVGT
jgi:GNAT superfamily N-acetyltransferase